MDTSPLCLNASGYRSRIEQYEVSRSSAERRISSHLESLTSREIPPRSTAVPAHCVHSRMAQQPAHSARVASKNSRSIAVTRVVSMPSRILPIAVAGFWSERSQGTSVPSCVMSRRRVGIRHEAPAWNGPSGQPVLQMWRS